MSSYTTPRGRYAPSPTGCLHLGNARTALAAWLHTRSQNGTFILRIEDLDSQRSKAEHIKANIAELRWLGLDWDEGPDVGGAYGPYLQSQRHACYQEVLKRLQPYLFECYLSRRDLQDMSSAPHEKPAVYGQKERNLNEQVKTQKQLEGKIPSLRFKVKAQTLSYTDLLRGEQRFCAIHDVGDFIVKRADGEWAYQLAVVVDDIHMRITEVLRGDDLLPSTAAQLLLYKALEVIPPKFLHVPLLADQTGQRMSKRTGALTLSSLKEKRVKAQRLVGLLAFSLGILEQPEEVEAKELIHHYAVSVYDKSILQLKEKHLEWLYEAS